MPEAVARRRDSAALWGLERRLIFGSTAAPGRIRFFRVGYSEYLKTREYLQPLGTLKAV